MQSNGAVQTTASTESQGLVKQWKSKHAPLARIMVKRETPLRGALWLYKQFLIQEAMRVSGGNKCRAARLLKIHRNTLTRDLTQLWPT